MHALLCTTVFLIAQTPEPVAMVLTAKGSLTLERDKDAPKRPGAMTLLAAGDKLTLDDGAEVTAVFLADGHRERIKSKTLATVGVKGLAPADKVEPIKAPKMTPDSLQSLRELARSARGGVGVLRSGDDRPGTPPVISPMYGATVVTDRPNLTWPQAKGVDAYLVQMLSGVEGREQRKLWQATVQEPKVSYPEKEKPLTAGLRYHWKVFPLKGEERGEPIVYSKFSVLTKEEMQILDGVKTLRDSKSAEDLLLAATVHEAHGAYDEALRLYERLAQMSPNEVGFHTALASYYERAGRKDLAEAARKRVKELAK